MGNDGQQSRTSEEELRSAVGDQYSPELLEKLRSAESELFRKRVALAEDAENAAITFAEFAIRVNGMSRDFIEFSGGLIGPDACRELYDYAPGDPVHVIDLEGCALEDTKRLQESKHLYAALFPLDVKEVEEAVRFRRTLIEHGVEPYAHDDGVRRGILHEAKHFAAETSASDRQCWFVLQNAQDSNPDYFQFIVELYKLGYVLFYAFEEGDKQCEAEVEKVVNRLVDEKGYDRNEVKGRVEIVALVSTPPAANICYLKSRDDARLIGFDTIRSRGVTIAGTRMEIEEAKRGWAGLQKQRKAQQKLRKVS